MALALDDAIALLKELKLQSTTLSQSIKYVTNMWTLFRHLQDEVVVVDEICRRDKS
jgi:hypothetical protein